MDNYQEYRCNHCNKLFFKGDLVDLSLEIKCKSCKNVSKVAGFKCPLLLIFKDTNVNYPDFTPPKEIIFKETLKRCKKCPRAEYCGARRILNDCKCPFCRE